MKAGIDMSATDVLRFSLSALLVDLERFLSVCRSDGIESDRWAGAASVIATAKKEVWEEASPKVAARTIAQAMCVLVPMGYRPPRWQDEAAELSDERVVYPLFSQRRPGEWRVVPPEDAEVIALNPPRLDPPDL